MNNECRSINRQTYFDVARGFVIVLMLIGHSGAPKLLVKVKKKINNKSNRIRTVWDNDIGKNGVGVARHITFSNNSIHGN